MFSNRLLFEPVIKINESFYRCDSKFHIESIVGMYRNDHIINGIVYTDGKVCVYYELKYGVLSKIMSSSIHLQNQFKNGGQSANRLMRNREIQRDHYITMMAERVIESFYDKKTNLSKVQNVIFCGPAQFKIEISQHKLIKSFFDEQHVHIINMSELNYDLLMDFIDKMDDPMEKTIIAEIRKLIAMADNRLIFGKEISQSLGDFQIETLYIHKDIVDQSLMDLINNPEISKRVKIIKISSHMITEYGGMIGVKYY